jgi:hypothetical protein
MNGYVVAKPGDFAEGEYTNQDNITKRFFSTNEPQEVALDIDDIAEFLWGHDHLVERSLRPRSRIVFANHHCKHYYQA